jgi:hypothetical protein
MAYLYSAKVCDYNSNKEYRENLRKVFQMDYLICGSRVDGMEKDANEKFDEETKDELEFDEESVQKAMDYVYDKTKDNELFKGLYKTAAAQMISMDPEIGLSICFSYDYFKQFHECIAEYLESPESWKETSETYKKMVKVLS